MIAEEKTSSCWLGLGLIALGAAAFWFSADFKSAGFGSNADPGPAAFPRILAAGLILGGIWELARSIWVGTWRESLAALKKREVLTMFVLVVVLVGYAVLISVVGFSVATIGFATALLIWRGMRWWIALATALGLVAVAVSLFVFLFKVQLPGGMSGLPF
ncbi:MAG: hypothetical protein ACI8UO_003119 [Verrucomicrobiales bacterium]|jgi:hypothetical protein